MYWNCFMPWAIPVHNFYEQLAFLIILFPFLLHKWYNLHSSTGPLVNVPQVSQATKNKSFRATNSEFCSLAEVFFFFPIEESLWQYKTNNKNKKERKEEKRPPTTIELWFPLLKNYQWLQTGSRRTSIYQSPHIETRPILQHLTCHPQKYKKLLYNRISCQSTMSLL